MTTVITIVDIATGIMTVIITSLFRFADSQSAHWLSMRIYLRICHLDSGFFLMLFCSLQSVMVTQLDYILIKTPPNHLPFSGDLADTR